MPASDQHLLDVRVRRRGSGGKRTFIAYFALSDWKIVAYAWDCGKRNNLASRRRKQTRGRRSDRRTVETCAQMCAYPAIRTAQPTLNCLVEVVAQSLDIVPVAGRRECATISVPVATRVEAGRSHADDMRRLDAFYALKETLRAVFRQ